MSDNADTNDDPIPFDKMGADPDRYAQEFAERFALERDGYTSTDDGTVEVMRVWFRALHAACKEQRDG